MGLVVALAPTAFPGCFAATQAIVIHQCRGQLGGSLSVLRGSAPAAKADGKSVAACAPGAVENAALRTQAVPTNLRVR
jgi:hypothetical protein